MPTTDDDATDTEADCESGQSTSRPASQLAGPAASQTQHSNTLDRILYVEALSASNVVGGRLVEMIFIAGGMSFMSIIIIIITNEYVRL